MITTTQPTPDDQQRAIAGDRDAAELFVSSMDNFIVGMFYKHNMKPNWMDDCLQAVRMALLVAIPKWDPAKGSWSTFAGHRARGAMLDWCREQSHRGYKRKETDNFPGCVSASKVVNEWGDTFADLIPDAESSDGCDAVDLRDLRDFMYSHSASLRMIAMYFLDRMTMKKIAKAIGISESRVSQIFSSIKSDEQVIDHVRRLAGV
jgi:RNA polymerase sigma factor (sigma-70 family)